MNTRNWLVRTEVLSYLLYALFCLSWVFVAPLDLFFCCALLFLAFVPAPSFSVIFWCQSCQPQRTVSGPRICCFVGGVFLCSIPDLAYTVDLKVHVCNLCHLPFCSSVFLCTYGCLFPQVTTMNDMSDPILSTRKQVTVSVRVIWLRQRHCQSEGFMGSAHQKICRVGTQTPSKAFFHIKCNKFRAYVYLCSKLLSNY